LVASGYYKWHLRADGVTQPYYIHVVDQGVFCFAGIWDRSLTERGAVTLSAAVPLAVEQLL
jgi:putative SOS response-associated peptidase YedK